MQQSLLEKKYVSDADLAVCRALLRNGSRTFNAASKVLPRNIRDAATALYAFCRVADDAIDLTGDHEAALITLRARLESAYAAQPNHDAVDRAFAGVVSRYGFHARCPKRCWRDFSGTRQAGNTTRSPTCKLTLRAWPEPSAR